MRASLHKNIVDFGLLLAAVFLFLAFFLEVFYLLPKNKFSFPLAQLIEGQTEHKPFGSILFSSAQLNQSFYNQDVLWVRQGQKAILKLYTGVRVELNEKTLIILKHPFKSKILTKYEIQDHLKIIKQSENQFTEIPDPKKIAQATPKDKTTGIQPKIYPPPQVQIYMKTFRPMSLVWSYPVDGYVVVRNDKTRKALYQILKNESFAKFQLPLDSLYQWQVIDKNKHILFGPFQFELKSFEGVELEKLLEQGLKDKNQNIEVIW